jgi:N-acetylglucosaminyl-diphospho-decaprenol L-rhamnosyltransferase
MPETKRVTAVGVIIVTCNSRGEIVACLDSIAPASSAPISIVVVDNASHDGTPELVESAVPNVCLIRNQTNRYYAAANNQGLVHAGGQYILLLNPDVVLPAGGIDALVTVLEQDEKIAAVAPQLTAPDGRRQHSLREFPGLATLWYDLLGLSFVFARSRRFGRWRMGYFDGQTERDVPQPMASCLMIRRRVIAEIGLFDERYPMFFNDVDWCKRVWDRGWRIWYTPSVRVCHAGGASTRRRKVRMIWMSHAAYFRYLRQYCSKPLWRQLAVWTSAPFLLFAAFVRMAWWGGRRTLSGNASVDTKQDAGFPPSRE